jgi:hypothetical protein
MTSFLADLTHVDDVYHIFDWAVIPSADVSVTEASVIDLLSAT